jgi:hypothetical protein
MTVTGATLQTSSAVNSGVKFDDNGISAYDDLGNRTVWIDADTGTLNATNGVFTGVINATGGAIAGILNMGIQGTTVIGTLPTSSDSWGFVFPGGMYTYANFSNGGVITQYTMASLTSGVLRAVAVDGPSGNKTDTVFGYNGVTMTSKPSGGTSLVVGQFTVSSQDLSISVFGKNSLKLAGGPGGSGSGNVVLDNTGVNINAPLRISNWPVIGSSLTLTTPLAVDSGGTGVTSLASLKTSLTDDTGWVAATFPSGMHSFDEGPNKVYWRVINGVAYWKGLVGKVGGGNFSTAQEAMIVLPPAARPSGSLQFPGVTAGTQGSGQVVSVYVNGGAGDYIYHLLTPTSPGTYISMTGIAYPVP